MRAARQRRIRDLSLGMAALVAVAFVVTTVVWVNIDYLQAANRNDNEARDELALSDMIRDATADQENALDGLVATNDRRFVAPFEEGRERLETALGRLSVLALNDPARERGEVAQIAALLRQWTAAFAEPQIAAVSAGRRPPPAYDGAGKRETAQIQRLATKLRDDELRLLQAQDQAQMAAYHMSRLALILGALAALGFATFIIGHTATQLMSERRLAEENAEQLRQALERAQGAERAKARFLANMSHEMRTPLNGVCGMAQVLANSQLEPSQRELVDAIQFSSVTLDHLIADLLSLSRDGAAERASRAPTDFRLASAARAAAKPFEAEALAKGLGFHVEIADAADVAVSGDPQRLGQLLACLLSNALKFTDQGQVRLSVTAIGAARYAFEVADTGVGFDEARKSELFATFGLSDDGDTRRHGGLGVGLALATRLTGELGGVLDAHSTPGAGSVFRLEIELAAATQAASEPANDAAAVEPTATAPEGVPFRVLVVDDNPTNRKVLELILEQVGAEWVSVEDGRQAVEAVRAQACSAILMDIQTPVMDGLTATREIRRLERESSRPAAPVIIVSASCQPEHVAAGRAAGAQAHLGKPVSAQAVIDALNDVLFEQAEAA